MHVKAKDEKAHNHTRVGSNPVMAEPFGRRRTWTKEKRMPDVCRMASHAFPREDVGSISRMIWRINKQCSGGTPQARVAIDPGQTSRDGQGTGWEDKTTKLRRHVTVGRENSFRCRSSSEGGGLRPSASTSPAVPRSGLFVRSFRSFGIQTPALSPRTIERLGSPTTQESVRYPLLVASRVTRPSPTSKDRSSPVSVI